MVRIGKGQAILGGSGKSVYFQTDFDDDDDQASDIYHSKIYSLTCSNRNCIISLLERELSVQKGYFVAIPIPDTISGCITKGKNDFQKNSRILPYVPPSSCCFQMGIWSPKQHLFDWEFCVGLPQTLCKQWAKGFCKILKFWPLHIVRQNVAGFRRGLFTCFLDHTPFLQYYLLFGPHKGCLLA